MRKFTRVQCVFVPFIITLLYSFTYFLMIKDNRGFDQKGAPRTTSESVFSVSSGRHVTKSLQELGKMDEINRHLLLLHPVPNCGGEILVFLLQKMQGFNNYRHVRLKGGPARNLTIPQQEKFVDDFYNIIRNNAVPLSFDRQIAFVNFTKFDRQSPSYINLIRDPVDKILRSPKKKSDLTDCIRKSRKNCDKKIVPSSLTIPHFCGHDKNCKFTNSKWAMEVAKNNVERFYPVVGILEEMNATLEVMQHKIPYFFHGSQDLYNKLHLDKLKQQKKRESKDEDIRQKMENIFHREFEFYDWIRQRLFRQLQILYGDHNALH